jgi:hypothetical protein
MDRRTSHKYLELANRNTRRIGRENRERHRANMAEIRERQRRARAREADMERAISERKIWILPASKTTFYIH